jgi:AraC family transcriptional regulator of adaptative response/methylated-DNA-[protein]-cysteine methyltransferase
LDVTCGWPRWPALPRLSSRRNSIARPGVPAVYESGTLSLIVVKEAYLMKTQTIHKRAAAETLVDPRWAAVVARDRRSDGQFFYSVKTTGVYCRPSCGARLANPANVGFHVTTAAAEAAGFRPCKRCKPDQLPLQLFHDAKVAQACRTIEAAEHPPALAVLARGANLSPHHFHRLFKAATGLTPKDYAAAHRVKKVHAHLAKGSTITAAIFDAGFSSNSRFYEKSAAFLGMTPTTFRDGGADAEIRFAVGQCSLGAILVAASTKGVCAILMGDDPEALVCDLQDRFSKATLVGADPAFEALVAKVVGFVEAPSLGLGLPLDVRGTVFQQRVWKALTKIPVGSTASYADVAAKIGAPKSVRAVAQACSANALAIAIPCHRVVRSNGSLSGYRWGIERKRTLLARERAISA